jgi:hypothetical protein
MSGLWLDTGLQICSFIQIGVENSKLQNPVQLLNTSSSSHQTVV